MGKLDGDWLTDGQVKSIRGLGRAYLAGLG